VSYDAFATTQPIQATGLVLKKPYHASYKGHGRLRSSGQDDVKDDTPVEVKGACTIVRPDDRHARRARELDRKRGAEHAREHRARGRARRVDGEEARGQREVRDEVREVAQDGERGEDRRRERALGLRGVVQARELAGDVSGGRGRDGATDTRSPAWYRCTG
jgi:hypothetical protein